MRFLCLLACILLCVDNSFAQISTMMPSPHHPEFNDYYLNPDNRGTITGKVLNLPDSIDREKLIGYSAVAMQRADYQQLNAVVAADGTFSIELPFSVPAQEVWFWLGDYFYTALLIRSTVHVEMDYAALAVTGKNQWVHPAVTFSGPDKELCEIKGEQIVAEKEAGVEFHTILMDRSGSTVEKKAKMDSALAILQVLDNKLLKGRSNEAASIVRNERLTGYFAFSNTLYWNEDMPTSFREEYLAHNPLTVSNRSTDFYSYFTTSIRGEAIREVKEKLSISHMEAFSHPLSNTIFLEKIDTEFSPARADLMKLYPEAEDPIVHTTMLEAMLSTMTTPWCKARLISKLKKLRLEVNELALSLDAKVDIISPKELGESFGHLDFEANLYISDAASGQELLDQVRGAFPDKAIYLDLWAVWCGPCIQQLPFSKQVHEAAEGLPIEFIYLCTESGGDTEKWQNLIANHKVPGTHLFVPNTPHNELLKLLLGRGYPTYVLIQPDGTVVHDVPRPSELDREKLEELLK